MLGHRCRPRQGCTCDDRTCGVPGAHPLPQGRPLVADRLEEQLRESLGAGLIARTERFDAVVVPRHVGMAAMIEFDRLEITPPCLLAEPHVCVLLVLPATGRYARVADDVEVRSGSDGWVALPPSRGVRWDTLPWYEGTYTPRPLAHGREVSGVLSNCFAVFSGAVNSR
jgi:hypothetical protein